MKSGRQASSERLDCGEGAGFRDRRARRSDDRDGLDGVTPVWGHTGVTPSFFSSHDQALHTVATSSNPRSFRCQSSTALSSQLPAILFLSSCQYWVRGKDRRCDPNLSPPSLAPHTVAISSNPRSFRRQSSTPSHPNCRLFPFCLVANIGCAGRVEGVTQSPIGILAWKTLKQFGRS
jgi:hypothetical protein